jgi:hypothetical protein
MAKPRGLPDSYKLYVSPTMTGKPVELGDYLDEEPLAPKPTPKPVVVEEPRPAPPVVAQLVSAAPRRVESALPITPVSERTPAPAAAASSLPARLRTTVPRKQINMNAETLGLVDQLMDYVQTYSIQKDLKGSELFHALVLTLYEAREHLDLSRVQPRGRWGTPTAAALPIALKNAFQKAIAKYCEENAL